MIATTAKLAELLEAYNPGSSARTEESIEARDRLNKAGYTLARLVLTLTEVAENAMKFVDDEVAGYDIEAEEAIGARKALAAVEELRL